MKAATVGSARAPHELRSFCETLENRVLLSAAWGGANYWAALQSQDAVAHTASRIPSANPSGAMARPALAVATTTDPSAITITRGGFRYNNAQKVFQQVLTLRNTGTLAVAGPLLLDLNIDASADSNLQINLVQVNANNVAISLRDPVFAFDTANGGRGDAVAVINKHSIIFVPPSGSFAVGATMTVTLSFTRLHQPASLNPGFNYQANIERPIPPSDQLSYVIAGNDPGTPADNTSPRDGQDNVQFTTKNNSNAADTGDRILSITNIGAQPVTVPAFSMEAFYNSDNFSVSEHLNATVGSPSGTILSLNPGVFTLSSDHQPVAFVDLGSTDSKTQYYAAYVYSFHPANAPTSTLQLTPNQTISVDLPIGSTPHHRPPKRSSGFINMSMK